MIYLFRPSGRDGFCNVISFGRSYCNIFNNWIVSILSERSFVISNIFPLMLIILFFGIYLCHY